MDSYVDGADALLTKLQLVDDRFAPAVSACAAEESPPAIEAMLLQPKRRA